MAVLPEHATSAFDVMWAPPSAPQTAQSTFRTAHKLCRLAEAAHRPLSESALASARDSAASPVLDTEQPGQRGSHPTRHVDRARPPEGRG